MYGQTLARINCGRLRRYKEAVDQMNFDLRYTLEYVTASRSFTHVPKPPDTALEAQVQLQFKYTSPLWPHLILLLVARGNTLDLNVWP